MNGPVGLDTAYKTLYNLFITAAGKTQRVEGVLAHLSLVLYLHRRTHGQELTGIPVRGAGLCLVLGPLTA